MTESSSSRAALGPTVVRLAALWILTGALFKLFVGTPNDLPGAVREFAASIGVSLTTIFRLAIAIELTISLPALLRPRLMWPLVAAQLAVFCAILVPLALGGAASCGCFGSKVTIPPWVMFAIDGTLLLALLATRPWRSSSTRQKLWLPIGAAVLAAWIAPFALVPASITAPPAPGSTTEGRRYTNWEPEEWVGKPLKESGIAGFVDVDLYPQEATWVLYNPTCEHCAAYLRRISGEFEQAPKMYVLVQLPPVPGAPQEVDLKPPGEEVVLPTGVEYVVVPPWVLEVAGGVVQSAVHPSDV